MDIKEIIESGKLELYALGALDVQEQKEMEELLENNPSLKAEYEQIADALLVYGKLQSDTPPMEILEKAKDSIEASEAEIAPKSIQMNAGNWWAIAASILLMVSVGVNLKLNSELEASKAAYTALEDQNRQMAANTVKMQENSNAMQQMLKQISSSNMQKVYMGGTDNYSEMGSTVYWDRNKNEVLLATQDLPSLSENEQYQLWAIIDGKPVDGGLFNANDTIVKMRAIEGNAVAFAVTIEPKGGSAEPTLSKMCMLGEVQNI